MNETIDYYDNNAETFVAGTLDVEFGIIQNRFLSLLPERGYILDFGCGSGRDTKYFLSRGYDVDAIDGSEKLCEIASINTGSLKDFVMTDILLISLKKHTGILSMNIRI